MTQSDDPSSLPPLASTPSIRGGSDVELRLPRPPGVFRRWLTAHPRAVDAIIIGSYLFGCALMILLEMLTGITASMVDDLDPAALAEAERFTGLSTWSWMVVRLCVVAITALALAYRRRFPFAGVVMVALLLFLDQGMLVLPNSVALAFLLSAVPVHRGVRLGWVAFGCTLVLNTILMMLGGAGGTGMLGPAGIAAADPVTWRENVVISVVNGLWLLAVLMVAINLGNRRRYVEALIDRAHQLAREREQQAQLAAASERSRIAREMHDIVAHSLSVVVTLSEAASVAVESNPAAAKRATERAAETGRSALVEMRRLLGVLGEGGSADAGAAVESGVEDRGAADAAPRAPQPGIGQLPELIDGVRQAGLRVTLTQSGVPEGDATQQLAVYRIVQEGLTNALRYAGRGAEAALVLEHTEAGTRIEIVDDGGGAGAVVAAPIPGSGNGLGGARERARMFGGTLEAGAHGSGWRILATVPVEAADTHEQNGATR